MNADESVNKAMNDVRKKFGKLDVLVNCFGVGNKITGNQTDDLEKFQHIVEVSTTWDVLLQFFLLFIVFYGSFSNLSSTVMFISHIQHGAAIRWTNRR